MSHDSEHAPVVPHRTSAQPEDVWDRAAANQQESGRMRAHPRHARARQAVPDSPSVESARPLPGASAYLVGALCAVLGLAPWLLTGMNLPLQNIWREDVQPDAMPIALLPLSQYYLVAAAAMVVVGSALGGSAARFAARRGRLLRAWLVAAGAATVQFVALVQSIWVLNGGLQDSSRAQWYVMGMFAGIAVAIIVGLAVTVLIGKAGVAAATIAITIAALALGEWLPTILYPIGNPALFGLPRLLSSGVMWLPTVAVGLAVGWCGFASVRRALGSVVSLLTFWVGSAAIVGLAVAIGSRAILQNPSGILPAATQAFRNAFNSASLTRELLLALIIAIIVTATLHALRRIERENEELAAQESAPAP